MVSCVLDFSFYSGFLLFLLNRQVLWKICLAEETTKYIKYVNILKIFYS